MQRSTRPCEPPPNADTFDDSGPSKSKPLFRLTFGGSDFWRVQKPCFWSYKVRRLKVRRSEVEFHAFDRPAFGPIRYGLKTDSQQCVSFAESSCAKSTMRGSFDWRADWVREVREKSQVVFEHVAGEMNLADIMTKCLKGPEFRLKRELVMN